MAHSGPKFYMWNLILSPLTQWVVLVLLTDEKMEALRRKSKPELECRSVGINLNVGLLLVIIIIIYHYLWKIDGETVETVAGFILGGSKITADGDWSHEIKRCLLLGRKVMANLDSILKIRDITLSTKVHLVKAMIFPVVMYGCESWTIKKAEYWRIDAFELWC